MAARNERESSDGRAHDAMRAVRAALAQLRAAFRYAHADGGDPWGFAVEIESLLALGLTTTDLRWLVDEGYVEHAQETTRPKVPRRTFLRCDNLVPAAHPLRADASGLVAQLGRR